MFETARKTLSLTEPPLPLAALLALVLAATVACGTDTGGSTGEFTGPAFLRGTTNQGTEVLLAVDESDRLIFTWDTLDCARTNGGSDTAMNDIGPFDIEAQVDDNAEFEGESTIVAFYPDGDETVHDVSVHGTISAGGTASGTLEVNESYVNGQAPERESGCTSGKLGWTAGVPSGSPSSEWQTLWAFNAVAEGDLERFDELVSDGVNIDARHPVRGRTFIESISEGCLPEAELGWGTRNGTVEPFPREDSPATVSTLEEARRSDLRVRLDLAHRRRQRLAP